jgi:hypothetical protein
MGFSPSLDKTAASKGGGCFFAKLSKTFKKYYEISCGASFYPAINIGRARTPVPQDVEQIALQSLVQMYYKIE